MNLLYKEFRVWNKFSPSNNKQWRLYQKIFLAERTLKYSFLDGAKTVFFFKKKYSFYSIFRIKPFS